MKPLRQTCKQAGVDSQADPLSRLDAALAEKSRCCRVMKMKLGASVTDDKLAEEMCTSREQIARWRRSDDRSAPTLLSLLLADEQTFDVLLRELTDARARLGHKREE